MTDDELIAWARANPAPVPGMHVSFESLWTADVDALAKEWPHPLQPYDFSTADAVLAEVLGYLTGGDRERTWRLLQLSALKRPKWEKEEYAKRLLDFACRQASADLARA